MTIHQKYGGLSADSMPAGASNFLLKTSHLYRFGIGDQRPMLHLFCNRVGTVCYVLHVIIRLDSKVLYRIDHSDRVKSQVGMCLLVVFAFLFDISPSDFAVGVAAVILLNTGVSSSNSSSSVQLANGHGVLDLARRIADTLCVDEKFHGYPPV